jgi:hypothetical protein
VSRKIVTATANRIALRPNEKNSYVPKNMIILGLVARKTITTSKFRDQPATSEN